VNLTRFYLYRFWWCLVVALMFVALVFVQIGHPLVLWRIIVCYCMSQLFGAMASFYLSRYYMFKDIWNTYSDVKDKIDEL
jgi:hypothetical protein